MLSVLSTEVEAVASPVPIVPPTSCRPPVPSLEEVATTSPALAPFAPSVVVAFSLSARTGAANTNRTTISSAVARVMSGVARYFL